MPCRNLHSISDDEEDEIVVAETTVSNSPHHTTDEEVGASLASAPLAADRLIDGMSTHEKINLVDDGDAHFPDQQMTDFSEGVDIYAEANNLDDTAIKTVDTEANTAVQGANEVQVSVTELRRSTRLRKKPFWQEKASSVWELQTRVYYFSLFYIRVAYHNSVQSHI